MGWQNRVASQPTLKKTPAAATQRKLKMIPVRIRFESDSNRIRIGFESDSSPAVVQRGICIETQKKKKENESASTRSIHKNANSDMPGASVKIVTQMHKCRKNKKTQRINALDDAWLI